MWFEFSGRHKAFFASLFVFALFLCTSASYAVVAMAVVDIG